jgi:hypothetical protein
MPRHHQRPDELRRLRPGVQRGTDLLQQDLLPGGSEKLWRRLRQHRHRQQQLRILRKRLPDPDQLQDECLSRYMM